MLETVRGAVRRLSKSRAALFDAIIIIVVVIKITVSGSIGNGDLPLVCVVTRGRT